MRMLVLARPLRMAVATIGPGLILGACGGTASSLVAGTTAAGAVATSVAGATTGTATGQPTSGPTATSPPLPPAGSGTYG